MTGISTADAISPACRTISAMPSSSRSGRASFTPDQNHVGWENTVHGGIIYAALDDVTANVMYKQGQKAHTARCEVRYRQPLYVGETIHLEGWVEKRRGRLILLRGEARKAEDDSVVADCTATFMLVDQE